jgi:uncharacterized protein (TIGR03546 family)
VQIGLAAVLDMIIEFTPLESVHSAILFLFVPMVRINLGIVLLSLGLFLGAAYHAGPIIEPFDFWLLHLNAFERLWTYLYQSSVWRLLEYKNSLVIGSFSAVILRVPLLFIGTKLLVVLYLERFMMLIKGSRLSLRLKRGKLF